MKQLLIAIGIIMTLTACEKKRSPCVYEIPDGFTGWVLIEFDRSNHPPLPIRDGKLVLRIGENGRLSTSSTEQLGWATDEFYFVGSAYRRISVTTFGGNGLIWGASTGFTETQGKKGVHYESFFVGTEGEFKKAGERPRP